jgi:hypothetical protein
MPVRKVRHHGNNIIGHFPSLKMKRMIAFESSIERDCIFLLDFEADIEWFEEQPLVIEYTHAGKRLNYTPDFHVVRNGLHLLLENKPAARIGTDENMRKFAAAREWCTAHFWQFRVVTDQQLRAGHRLANVKLLTQHARHIPAPEIAGRICAALSALQPPMTLAELAAWATPDNPPASIATILSMIYHHRIFIDLDIAPISGDSAVALPRFYYSHKRSLA